MFAGLRSKMSQMVFTGNSFEPSTKSLGPLGQRGGKKRSFVDGALEGEVWEESSFSVPLASK
jgi:hypothetical protein